MNPISTGFNLKGTLESLAVFGIMTCLFLPVRLVFVEYVSDDWLGSFGILSAMSVAMIILAKKKKLGFFGPMLQRQVQRFQKNKRTALFFGESILLLLILGSTIFAIDQGNSVNSDLKPKINNDRTYDSVQSQILEITKDWTFSDWAYAYAVGVLGFVTDFPAMSASIAYIDESTDGWLLHFYTVGFVEYVELLGLFALYKMSLDRRFSTSRFNALCSKIFIRQTQI